MDAYHVVDGLADGRHRRFLPDDAVLTQVLDDGHVLEVASG